MYAIHLFQCIDFVPFTILQIAQKLNVCEEVQQNNNEYQEKIRVKELCPHVCNSVEEFLLMPIQWIDTLSLGWASPWNSVWDLIGPRGKLWSFCDYSVILSWNVSSIIVPRCLSSS